MEKIRKIIYENNLSELTEYLKYNDINYLDEKQNSLLHYAIIYKKLEIAYYLIKEHIFVNQTNALGETPLYLAVHFNLLTLVDALLKNNANPNLVNNNHETAFYHACRLGRKEIISLFIEYYDYDFSEKNNQGENALFALVRNNDLDLFKKYYKKDLLYVANNSKATLLHIASLYPNTDLIRFLLNEGLNINKLDSFKEGPLFYALRANNFKAIITLLRLGALTSIKNQEGNTFRDLIIKVKPELLDLDRTEEYLKKFPLHYAIILNDSFLFSKSLSLENLLAKDFLGYTALILAQKLENRKFYKEIKLKESQSISLRSKKW